MPATTVDRTPTKPLTGRAKTARLMSLLALTVTFALLVGACGGSDASTAATADVDDTADGSSVTTVVPVEEIDAASAAEIESVPVVIPTSTPLPTATPLPSPTPVPLDAPTPSAILLGSAFTNDSKVTTVGIDEVFFGMAVAEAAQEASTTWVGESSGGSNCYKVVPETGPQGITLWIVDGFVERIDIEHPDLRTPSRLGVGNRLAELEGQLGERLTTETADDGTVVATFTPADEGDRDFRIIFELVDDAVVHYRSGRVGIVDQPADQCYSSLPEG